MKIGRVPEISLTFPQSFDFAAAFDTIFLVWKVKGDLFFQITFLVVLNLCSFY